VITLTVPGFIAKAEEFHFERFVAVQAPQRLNMAALRPRD
jgi:hypothetical protein